MATVSSLGSGSGLDLSGLLTSLMQAEQKPLTALQTKEASYQTKLSAYGSLKSALSSLQTAASALVPGTGVSVATKYQTATVSVADTSIASATANSSAMAGEYSLAVSALAKSHRLTSPDSTNSAGTLAVTNGLAAGGTLKIELGSLSTTGETPTYAYTADASRELNVTIAANSTLEQMRDAINAAATDGRVTATIISGTGGKQLVLTSGQSGTANVMKLSGVTGFDFDPGSALGSGNLSQATANGGQSATDAAFTLNGIAGTSSTNTVSGVLDGVTLTLNKVTVESAPTKLIVSTNKTTALTTALTAFIKSYNDANTSMTTLGAYNATTKVAGTLQGNSTLRSAQTQIRNLVFNTTSGGSSIYQRLSDIGVSVGKDGSLSLDSSKLNKAANADFSSVAGLVSKIGTAFDDAIDGMVGSTGSITSATDSTNRLIKSITAQGEALSLRLSNIEARYRAQFTALDTLISSMKQTSTYLTQQLASLPSVTSSSN